MKWIGGYTRMGNLKFKDIDEWTPSSISIVDEPSHPCCHFEVYHDDEEYVKKSIEVNEGEMMVENPQNQEQEPMVHAPVSFFEKLLGRTVGKAVEDEVPKPPVKEEANSNLESRVAALEKKVANLEKEEEKPKEEEEKEPAPGAVTKSEGESSEAEATTETSEEGEQETEEKEDEVLDDKEVVAKSKSIDPDTVTPSATSEKSLVERAGRNINGMSW